MRIVHWIEHLIVSLKTLPYYRISRQNTLLPGFGMLVMCSCTINCRHPSFIFSCIHLRYFEPQDLVACQIRIKVTWYNLYLHLAAPHLFRFCCTSPDHVKNNQSKSRVVSRFYAYAPTSGDLLKHRNHVRAYST